MEFKEDWFVTICPKCKSTQVMITDIVTKNSPINNYACLSCGFEGPIFPEIRLVDMKKLPNLVINCKYSSGSRFADGAKYKKSLRRISAKERIILIMGCSLAVFILLLLLTNS